MLTQKRSELLKEKTRTEISPSKLDIIVKHIGSPSEESGKKRQYLSPNSAFLAKGAKINFVEPEFALNYLINSDNTIKNLIRADTYFAHSIDKFLWDSAVENKFGEGDVVGLTALSPEITKLCRIDYHNKINDKLGVSRNDIPNEDQEFDFIVDNIIAQPYSLGPVLERGHNDTKLGTHILKPEISSVYMDMFTDIKEISRERGSRKFDNNQSELESTIKKIIRGGFIDSKSVSRPVNGLLKDLRHGRIITRPINYSRRLDSLSDLDYPYLNSELDLKIPLKGSRPIITNAGNNHGVISTYNSISRQTTNPI